MFEGVYSVPGGVSYNSYLLMDDNTVLFDTVDKAVGKVFFENISHVLGGRKLDYLVIHHMEPDHSATLSELMLRYPDVKIVCNDKTVAMIDQFFGKAVNNSAHIVKEGDTLNTGHHELTFLMAPMVHWPEVMVTYDKTSGTLFSADAFGAFGALNGALFADEVNFDRDYLDEARRYYCNIVGKYGMQVQTLLQKLSALELNIICPLHGFVWRKNIGYYIEKYQRWSLYIPEDTGVMIAYASIYGNTENAAEILSSKLREIGIKTVMYDVSVTPSSEIVAAAFRWSHLVFASSTYNTGIFVSMEGVLRDIAAHNLQNRTVAFIQNGSWAPASGALMRNMIAPLKNMTILDETVDICSSLKPPQLSDIDAMVVAISATMPSSAAGSRNPITKLSYGLFVLTAKEGDKDNGCIINTPVQLTSTPELITIAVNKSNYTRDMIMNTGVFNLSILTENVPFKVFQHFGFQSGRNVDKFADCETETRSANGLLYIPKYTNAFISCKVINSLDYSTHTLFVAEVTESKTLSNEPSVTYAYYFDHIKPKPQPKPSTQKKKGFICKICGYVYEGDELPADFICPVCKHGTEVFEPLA